MLSLLLASTAANAARENPITAELTSIFISACLDGKIKLAPGQIDQVDAKGVDIFWEPDRHQRNARYYKISKPVGAALVVTDYDPPTEAGFKSTCDLVSRGFDIETAWYLVSAAFDGKPAQHSVGTNIYTVDHPAGGFRLEVRSWNLGVGHYADQFVQEARSRPGGPKKMTVTAEDSIFE